MIFQKVPTPDPVTLDTLVDPGFAGVSLCLPSVDLLIQPEDMPAPPAFGSDAFWDEWLEVCSFVADAKFWTEEPPLGATAFGHAPYAVSPVIEVYLAAQHRPDQSAQTRRSQLAAAVRGDHPTELGRTILAWLQDQGAEPRLELVANVHGDRRFAHNLLCNALIGEAVQVSHPHAFAAKWHFLRPRPEEVASALAKGEIEAPAHIFSRATQLLDWQDIVRDPTAFTTYSAEGCPLHPAYPAMHGAAAGLSLLFAVLFDLTPEQRADIQSAAADWSYGRSFAGVHYRSDNDAGLWLGEQVLAAWLPSRLASDQTSAAQIEALCLAGQTDWLGA